MFDINEIKKADDKRGTSSIVKKLRYLLFSFKEEADRIRKKEEFTGVNQYFSDSEMDDIRMQVEKMEHFDGWINFGITFDVVWAGLYIDTDNRGAPVDVFWRPGFHGADRQLIFPIRLTHVNKVKRMETTYKDTRKIMELEIPPGLKNEVMKNKKKQAEYLERQMVGQTLPGGDTFAKETIKADKIQRAVDEQKALNDKLKAIAKEEREENNGSEGNQ